MISVCIPIYNYDVRETVARLLAQAEELSVPCEVVCLDDASELKYRELNRQMDARAKYVELEENVGRSRIRNLLPQYAQYEYLVFIDCDSIIPDGFLKEYADLLELRPEVVCGGRVYDPKDNDRRHRLRYVYGVKCESKRAEERVKNPFRSFMTNNFIVRRDILEATPFDEKIKGYGHEDTLFGHCLLRKMVDIWHIENPVVNGDVEDNEEFLKKTQAAIVSLWHIYSRMYRDWFFVDGVRLLRVYEGLQRWHLLTPVRIVYRCLRKPLERGFKSGRCVNMKLFAFYKLGRFIDYDFFIRMLIKDIKGMRVN